MKVDAPPGFQMVGLAEAKKRLEQARKARKPYEADWYLNMAFAQGQQWVAWDGSGLYTPKMKRGKVTLTDNRIRTIIRGEVARLTKARPGWTAVPRGLDEQAVTDAQASVRLLDFSYDHLSMAEHRREAITWARTCSAGFIKTVWDPLVGKGLEVMVTPQGKAIPNPKTGRPARPGEMPEVESIDGVTRKTIGAGDVSYVVRSPFDTYPDPLATCLGDARWIIDESVRSPEYVKDRYDKVVSPDAAANVGIVESRFQTANADDGGEKIGVRVFEMWERSSPSNPHGRRLVWCEGHLLYEGVNEYVSGGEAILPYAMFPGVIVPGRFWPDAPVTDLRPLQARINKLISQIAENLARFGNPSLLIDKLAGIEYAGAIGEQIRHNAASPTQLPQFLQPPSMPGYIFNLVEQLNASLREIGGHTEVSQGQVPAGVTAAAAISLLQEGGADFLAPDIEANELAMSQVGQQTIELIARYYTTDRIVVVVGEDGIVDVDTFRAGVSFQVPDVTVQAMSTFPRSQAARQAAIRDTLNMMFQYGVPIDSAALSSALRDMQVGGLERLVQSYTADSNQVGREHVDFLRGKDPEVREVDNDAVHIAGHEDFMKAPRFLALPEERQKVMVAHVRLHKEQAKAEAAAAAAVPPPPGAAPGGPPPPPPGTVPTYPSGNPMAATDPSAQAGSTVA